MALVVASHHVEPPQAHAIAEIFASALGRRWLDAETSAHVDTESRFAAFADAALAARIVFERDPEFDKLPLLVPKQYR